MQVGVKRPRAASIEHDWVETPNASCSGDSDASSAESVVDGMSSESGDASSAESVVDGMSAESGDASSAENITDVACKKAPKYCPHGRYKYYCRECGGGAFCEHGSRRAYCKPCGGRAICVHNIIRSHCKPCGGSCICEHKRDRAKCAECGGASRCKHGKQRLCCKECVPTEKMMATRMWCKGCASKILSEQRKRAGIQFCKSCEASVPDRTEVLLRPLLLEAAGFPPSAVDDASFGGQGCGAGLRRPDIAWLGTDRVIFGEVDEDGGHPDRLPECELGRMWDLTVSAKKLLGEHVRVFFIRLNPHEYDAARVSQEERVRTFGRVARELMAADMAEFSPLIPHVKYLFYHSKCVFQIEAARAKPDSIHVM